MAAKKRFIASLVVFILVFVIGLPVINHFFDTNTPSYIVVGVAIGIIFALNMPRKTVNQ